MVENCVVIRKDGELNGSLLGFRISDDVLFDTNIINSTLKLS